MECEEVHSAASRMDDGAEPPEHGAGVLEHCPHGCHCLAGGPGVGVHEAENVTCKGKARQSNQSLMAAAPCCSVAGLAGQNRECHLHSGAAQLGALHSGLPGGWQDAAAAGHNWGMSPLQLTEKHTAAHM